MLPSNFWEEFDRRLDARLDMKLDEKLEAKLKPINDKINKLIHWTERQDESIEREITYAMKVHLQDHFKSFVTVEPKIFPKEIKRPDGTILTEFDGIMILTNVREYRHIVVPEKTQTTIVDMPADIELYIIIVEAKQHLTAAKVTKKIKQKEAIEQYIRDVHAGMETPPRSLQRVLIDKFKPTVGLYIGGVDVDQSVRERIREYAKSHSMCGMIDLNGSRFSIKDATNDFGENQFGGKKKNAK